MSKFELTTSKQRISVKRQLKSFKKTSALEMRCIILLKMSLSLLKMSFSKLAGRQVQVAQRIPT